MGFYQTKFRSDVLLRVSNKEPLKDAWSFNSTHTALPSYIVLCVLSGENVQQIPPDRL